MTDTTIRKSIFLPADRATVWAFLTDPAKLEQWFHPADAPIQTGQPYTLRNSRDGDKMCWGEVLEMTPHSYMKWSFTVGPMDGALSTVEWHLEDAPGGTRLSLTHSGLPQSAEGFGLVLALDKGWHGFVGNLQILAQTGGDYMAVITVPATPAQAQRAIFDEMDAWWTSRVESTDDGVTVRFNNSHASFAFEGGDANDGFRWLCTDANMIIEGIEDSTEWQGTRLIWHIRPDPSGARVMLTHKGLNTDLACHDVCSRGWQHFFENSLKAHLSGQSPSPELS